MRTVVGAAALLLLAAGACVPAPHARRTAPANPGPAVVKRMVRLNSHGRSKPPVIIQVVPGAVVGSGRQRVRVVVTPLADAEQVNVEVETHDGLSVAQGRHKWQIAGRANVAATEELTLAATGPGERRLLVTATLVFKGGTQMTGIEALALNPGPRTARQIPGSRVITTPDGRKIREIPAEEIPAPAPTANPNAR